MSQRRGEEHRRAEGEERDVGGEEREGRKAKEGIGRGGREGRRGEAIGIDGWEGVRRKLRKGREEMEKGRWSPL